MWKKLAATSGIIALLAATLTAFTPTKSIAGGPPPPAGVYVYYDWRNLNPASYPWIKGGETATRWNIIESSEGVMNWSSVDNFLNIAASQGKGTVVKVTANDQRYDGVPNYVYNAGVPKIWVGSYFYPKWWDSTFISKYTGMVSRFGQKYNNDSRVSAIALSIGEYGEAMPGSGNLDWTVWPSYWTNAGLTSDIWVDYNKRVIDAYVAAFPNKPLFLQEQSFPDGNTAAMHAITDYAASKGVNMGFNGLAADNDKDYHWYNPFAKYVEPGTLMGRLEQGPPSINQQQVYWSALNALRNHARIISFYDTQNMDWGNQASFDFANKYAGKTIQNTPGVWSAFMDTNQWAGHTGNYEYWLYQLNPANTSITLYNVDSSKEGMFARRTDQASGKNYLSFNVDDRYIFGGTSSARLTVTYYDAGWDSFELQYDATTNAYKSAGVIQKTNTYTWKKAVFNLNDATFANREGGADLRLYGRQDGDDTFHMVEIERLETSPLSPTPTTTPSPTATLTPAPTNTRTPVPSATPTPLPTATPTPVPLPQGWDQHKAYLPVLQKN